MGNELQRSDKGIAGFLKSLTMTDTDRANAINRSVSEYHPCAVSKIIFLIRVLLSKLFTLKVNNHLCYLTQIPWIAQILRNCIPKKMRE